MQRLILMRHGKAERATAGGEDFERALEPRGRRDAALVAEALRVAGAVPDTVLVSPALRTAQTWEAVSAIFPEARGRRIPALYHAPAERIAELVEQETAAGAGTLMVIGHNPGLHMLTLDLLRQGAASPSLMAAVGARFPTSTAAVFGVDAAGRPAYEGLFLAKDHGGGGGE